MYTSNIALSFQRMTSYHVVVETSEQKYVIQSDKTPLRGRLTLN